MGHRGRHANAVRLSRRSTAACFLFKMIMEVPSVEVEIRGPFHNLIDELESMMSINVPKIRARLAYISQR